MEGSKNLGLQEASHTDRAIPGAAAFAKFMAVLQLVADLPGELSMAELSRRSRLPRSTVYRIVAALRAEGLINNVEPFTLGPRLISLASRSWDSFDLRTLASVDLRALRDSTGETVHLAVPSRAEMVYIHKLESSHPVRMTSKIGTRVLLHASSVGKAYLAALPPAERSALLGQMTLVKITAHTIVTVDALNQDLAEIRQRGYAFDREETEPDIFCVGAVITNGAGLPVGAISVSVPKYRLGPDSHSSYPQLVLTCARRISERVSAQAGPESE